MRTSEATDKLDAALSAALGELSNPGKSKTAKVQMKAGGSYSYQYADIADVLTMARPVLSKHKVSMVQGTSIVDGLIILTTRLAHAGQWVESDYPVCRAGGDHKEMGAAMTYSRRYALTGLIGVAAEDDTDGEGAASSGVPDRREPTARRDPVEPPKPTLSERANRLESALRAKQGDADAVQAVWDRNAGLCADLDDKAPERLAELETLLKMLLATPDQMAAE